jgi:C-terminal processing protease CtpA/Prc
MCSRPLRVLSALAVFSLVGGAATAQEFVPGRLFEHVSDTLLERFYDKTFRKERLPELVETYREHADASRTLEEERIVVDSFLSHVPASHLSLLERDVYRQNMGELNNKKRFQLGFEVEQRGSRFFVFRLHEDGPAAKAGLLRGDRVVEVDGVPIEKSESLSGSSDDAALPDAPLRYVKVSGEQTVKLLVERSPGKNLRLEVTARSTNALAASRASARVIESEGRRFGYVHLWFLTITGTAELVREKMAEDFRDCDGLILDMRGRGGSAQVVYQLLDLIHGKQARWRKPVVVLVDRCTRSGKEAFAWEVKERGAGRIVGERTAGALVPASFADVGQGYVLMFPAMRLGKLTDEVELKGVSPDVEVGDSGPYAAGRDPILEAGIEEVARMHRASR